MTIVLCSTMYFTYFFFKPSQSVLTTFAPKPSFDLLPSFPVYTSKRETYPFVESPNTQTFNPLLMGFIGRYCFMVDLHHTIATSLCRLYEVWNWLASLSKIGLILPNLLYPGVPVGTSNRLSAKCKYRGAQKYSDTHVIYNGLQCKLQIFEAVVLTLVFTAAIRWCKRRSLLL